MNIRFLMILVAVFALCGCETQQDPDPGETPEVTPESEEAEIEFFDPTTLEMDDELVATLSFSTNVDWSLNLTDTKATPSWMTVSPMSGIAGDVVLTISLEENPTIQSRVSYIVVNAGDVAQTITVEQAGGVATISLSESVFVVDAGSGSFSVELSSNSEWSIVSSPSWIEVSPSSGSGDTQVTLSYQENESVAQRNATIEFVVEGNSAELSVEQGFYNDKQLEDLQGDTI